MNLAILWASSLAWHLWRILTLRPAYQHLKDGPGATSSFVLVYFIAGLSRFTMGMGFWTATVMLTINLVLVLVLFERRERSSILPLCILGASAATDWLVTFTMAVGWTPLTGETPYKWSSVLEIILIARVIYCFTKLPPEKRRAEPRVWSL